MNPRTQLRMVQFGCFILLILSIWLSRVGSHKAQGQTTTLHWVMFVAAIYSAISGFTLQRKLNRTARVRRVSSASTPFTRWRAANVLRLATATATGIWGLCLYEMGGPSILINALFVIGVVLVLIWSPGVTPPQTQG